MRTALVLSSLLAAATVAGPTFAAGPEQSGQAGAQAQQNGQIAQLQQRMRELQGKLKQVQSKAMKNNPELKEEAKALENLVLDTAREHGYEPKKNMEKMQELRKQAQNGDMSEADRKKLAEQFRAEKKSLREGQKKALDSEAVKKARKNYSDNLMAAMEAEEPKTGAMIEELQQIQNKFRQMMMSRMQGAHGGGS